MCRTILSYMHILSRRADLLNKKHFSRYNHSHILCMCSKTLYSDDRLLCDIEISGKTQNYRLKSVCNFKVTRFYLILPCKQHNWTSGTYSIEMFTWSHENRVGKHFSIFLNLPCLISCLLCCLLMSYFFGLVLWLGICVEVDVDRITILPPSLFFPLPTILSLTQVTVISLKSAGA